jgi:hypothetical protein
MAGGAAPGWIGSILAIAFVLAGLFALNSVGNFAEARYSSLRFPEKTLDYKTDDLKKLAASGEKAAFYASPVLFPLDFIVMLLLTARRRGPRSISASTLFRPGWCCRSSSYRFSISRPISSRTACSS